MEKRFNCMSEISWQKIDDTVYVFNEKSDEVHILQNSALDFWLLINKLYSRSKILDIMANKYNISKERLSKDFDLFLETLKQKMIICEVQND